MQTSAVAGVFLVAATALLAWDYSRRLAKDPLDSEEFKALRADLAVEPQNEELKGEIRDLDRMLRAQYFEERRFAARGGWVLLGGAVVFLIALRTAATLRRRLPQPDLYAMPVDTEAPTERDARWAVAGIAGVLALAGIGLTLGIGTVVRGFDAASTEAIATAVPPGGDETATTPAASGPTDGAKTPASAAASAPGPAAPKDEIGKSWPRFRGPSGLGISAYTNVPTSWDGPAGKNVLWKTPVPLEGNSSPVVWKDRLFLSGATDRVRQVYCFDTAGGKLVWQKDMPPTPAGAAKPPEVNGDTGYAANTPVTDGNRLYVTFAIGDVAAFDFAGNLAWVRSLGIPKNPYGHATSLAMVRNLLLVQLDQAIAKDGKSRLLALDAATGKSVWETPRPVPSSWCTPIVIEWKGQEQIVAGGDPWTIAYQPADGKEIWRAKCLGQDVAASPVFADGVVYVGNANAKASAIRVDGHGDVTESRTLWTAEDGLPDTSSPLATPQYVLLLTSSGTLTSYDAKNGKKLWEKDFDSSFKASPSLVGKNVYLLGDEGKAWIVEPGPTECKIIAQATVGEPCAASPAFQDGRIYVRGRQHLFCIGSK